MSLITLIWKDNCTRYRIWGRKFFFLLATWVWFPLFTSFHRFDWEVSCFLIVSLKLKFFSIWQLEDSSPSLWLLAALLRFSLVSFSLYFPMWHSKHFLNLWLDIFQQFWKIICHYLFKYCFNPILSFFFWDCNYIFVFLSYVL